MANVINKIKKGTDEYDIQDPNAATKTELQALETTVSGKQNALTETQLAAVNSGIDSTKVGQIATNTTNIGTNTNDISTINGKIPAQASSSNQLADKAFVTDAVQTNSAHFRGNWATWNDVPTDPTEYPIDDDGNRTPTSNDYMVIQDASGFPTSPDPALEGTWRFKYSGVWSTNGKNGWHPEYQVNETPLTSDQLAALNSGITAEAVTKLGGIESGAEVNDIDSISVNGVAVTPDANKNVALTIPSGETIKTLTTDDYNYPTTGTKTDTALWLLPDGIYQGGKRCRVFSTASFVNDCNLIAKHTFGDYAYILVMSALGSNDYRTTLYRVQTINGSGTIYNDFGVVDDLTSVSAYKSLSAKQGKYLNDNKADKTAFTGTDGTAAGTMGLVPAPATTDAGKFLKADGTWGTATAEDEICVVGVAGGETVTNADLCEKIRVAYNARKPIIISTKYNIGLAIEGNISSSTWTSGSKSFGVLVWYKANYTDGSYNNSTCKCFNMTVNLSNGNITCSDWANGGINPGIFTDKVGTLSSLTTTAKTSAVAAINELDSDLGGLKFVSISQTDYDNLQTYDPNTLYVITGA